MNAANETEKGCLSLDEISRILVPYVGKLIPQPQLVSIPKYLMLLKKWNQTVPLTSIEDEAEIVARHFGESLFAGSLLPLERGRLADVGSGAGFPGLSLKIAFPELHVALLEPNVKKCAFLREAQALLGLSGLDIVHSRYEDFATPSNSLDFICSRALGGYKRLLQWSRGVLKPDGRLVLWLGIEDSNLLARTRGWNWALPTRLPESRRRVLLSGSPAK